MQVSCFVTQMKPCCQVNNSSSVSINVDNLILLEVGAVMVLLVHVYAYTCIHVYMFRHSLLSSLISASDDVNDPTRLVVIPFRTVSLSILP